MNPLYTAKATSTGAGRLGHVASSDGVLEHDLSMPKELGGAGGGGTNPEQLFAAGYAACFHSALQGVARREKLKIADSSVTAEVGIGKQGEGFGLAVTLEIALPGIEHAQAEKLVEAAHQMCPYSNATRGNIDVDLKVV
ncbi:organic hydroperoxide resistance protein [Actinophytocola sp.]|uniref:organic hydroperoxide resistance protein n=1 Tax=Actinophytocola sp. TaxID=1872138 RepID=UPI003899F44D